MRSASTYGQADLELGAPLLERHRADPCAFFYDILGIEDIHGPMREIAESVRDNKFTAIAGCHDSSKSYTLAALVWWWVTCFAPAKVITTSASGRQVDRGLWSEIRGHYERSRIPLGGTLAPRAPQWDFDAETFAIGFTTRDDTSGGGATRFQGFKSENRLVIMDEAVEIPRGAWESIKVGLSGGPHTRIVAAANPTDPACEFARCWRPSSPWCTINISAFDLPNLIEGRVLFDYLPTPEWVNDQRTEYGEDHPLYQARVLGVFPDEAVTTLISMRDFRAACNRAHGDITAERVGIGCDVALQGDDSTFIVAVKGSRVLHMERLNKRSGDEVGAALWRVIKEFNIAPSDGHMVAIDSTGGYGEAPENYLRREHRFQVRKENFSTRPVYDPDDPKKKKYLNRRAEIWSKMAEWLRDEAALKDSPAKWLRWMEDDLPGVVADYKTPNSVLRLERKEDMKKRLGHSPDCGDALALALSWRTSIGGLIGTLSGNRLRDADSSAPLVDREHPSERREREKRQRRDFYDHVGAGVGSGGGRAGFYD